MESAPLVSIITIVYNGEKYIENVIRSVLAQTYPNIEYIIVDGGSKDNTVSIIKKYEYRLGRWISEKDKGISDAFNKGINMAKGSIIGIINSDDWYEPDAVAAVVQHIGDNDVAFGDMRLWKKGVADYTIKGNDGFLEHEMSVNHPTVFVKRKCYEQFGVFDLGLKCAMDYDLLLRFKVNGCTFKYIPQVLANMRWEGLSDIKWMLGCRETLQIKNKYLPEKKLRNRLYFYKHVTAIAVPKLLHKLKLNFLVKLYRSRFARIKKVYD